MATNGIKDENIEHRWVRGRPQTDTVLVVEDETTFAEVGLQSIDRRSSR